DGGAASVNFHTDVISVDRADVVLDDRGCVVAARLAEHADSAAAVEDVVAVGGAAASNGGRNGLAAVAEQIDATAEAADHVTQDRRVAVLGGRAIEEAGIIGDEDAGAISVVGC